MRAAACAAALFICGVPHSLRSPRLPIPFPRAHSAPLVPPFRFLRATVPLPPCHRSAPLVPPFRFLRATVPEIFTKTIHFVNESGIRRRFAFFRHENTAFREQIRNPASFYFFFDTKTLLFVNKSGIQRHFAFFRHENTPFRE